MSFRTWLAGVFGRPTQFDPAKYGTVRVYFGQRGVEWDSQKLAWFEAQLLTMQALGPRFVRALDPNFADVTVLHWDSQERGDTLGAGLYTPSKRLIQIDPVGCQGELELRTCLGHELMHHLGCTHIARTRDEAAQITLPSPVGIGPAVGNPCLNYDRDVSIGMDTVEFHVSVMYPTALDLAEFRRVWAARR
jgi:hypothetical protein